MFVLLNYYFDETTSENNTDKANFLLKLGRESLKHKFLSKGSILAQFERVDLETIVRELSDGISSLHLIAAIGMRNQWSNSPTIVATTGILDDKDWHC